MQNRASTLVTCAQCGSERPAYDIVHYGTGGGSYRDLCTACVNFSLAERAGLEDFAHPVFAPIRKVDGDGVEHVFRLSYRFVGDRSFLEAFEVIDGRPGGYEIAVMGDAEEAPQALHEKLLDRITRRLATKDLERDVGGGLQIRDRTVRAGISCDLDADLRRPMLVIDGREVDWDAFGTMLMTFEGWQFRMEIVDRSDEV